MGVRFLITLTDIRPCQILILKTDMQYTLRPPLPVQAYWGRISIYSFIMQMTVSHTHALGINSLEDCRCGPTVFAKQKNEKVAILCSVYLLSCKQTSMLQSDKLLNILCKISTVEFDSLFQTTNETICPVQFRIKPSYVCACMCRL